jgi:hypothetical protein
MFGIINVSRAITGGGRRRHRPINRAADKRAAKRRAAENQARLAAARARVAAVHPEHGIRAAAKREADVGFYRFEIDRLPVGHCKRTMYEARLAALA